MDILLTDDHPMLAKWLCRFSTKARTIDDFSEIYTQYFVDTDVLCTACCYVCFELLAVVLLVFF